MDGELLRCAENSAPYVIVGVAFGGDILWRDLGDGDVMPEDCISCSFDGLEGESSTTCLDFSSELVPFIDGMENPVLVALFRKASERT